MPAAPARRLADMGATNVLVAGGPGQALPAVAPSFPSTAPRPASLAPQSADPASEKDSLAKLRELHEQAVGRYAGIDSYIVRLRRREQVNGKDNPEEVLFLKFRKQPWSVYFKWLGTPSNGREVVYVKGQHDSKIHTLLAAGDMPLMPAGRRISLDPDNILARSSSRHSIQEAGIGVLIEQFGHLLDAAQMDERRSGTLRYLGPQQRAEFDEPCEAVEQTVAAGVEPQMARGGRRLWLFDPASKFPALIVTQDDTGHEVEYYCYDRFQFPVYLDDNDFNPDKLWNRKR